MKESAEKWDSVAQDYQSTYDLCQSDYSTAMLTFWENNGMLKPGMRVLDIGCGVGKYGACFARLGCDVTLTDISGEMLRRAAQNMAEFTTPWKCIRGDFNELDEAENTFSKGFDFSISTMSPAVHDEKTVRKMSGMTKSWCFLTRFVAWEQPGRDALLTALTLEAKPPLENMKEDCAALIQAVSAAGFVPQVKYVDYCWRDSRTPEQMASQLMKKHLNDGDKIDEAKVISAARSLSGRDGLFEDAVNTKVAWIYWNTNTLKLSHNIA